MSRSKTLESIKYSSSTNNPCMKERQMSFKCLGENNYKSDECAIYFDNYNNCNEFWNKVQLMRRRNGITPILPVPEERDKIKEEYLKNMKEL